ncbi:MAG: DUF2842 domain-containing protein [Pseudomonadota bacterium]
MKTLRKIVATFALVTFIIIYSLAVMVFAVRLLPETSALFQLVFYTVTGLIWVIPAGFIIWLGWRGERAIQPER